MIFISKEQVLGIEPAFRGMRNPLNSWDNGDSSYDSDDNYVAGPNDIRLASSLAAAGPSHSKFRRMITVYVDITAPLYWWKEFDTYKVGTVANSCSTMHKIHSKKFEMSDFSHEHLQSYTKKCLKDTINILNEYREAYITFNRDVEMNYGTRKDIWWQMIQLLPSSYNQKRTVMLNYEVLANIYETRANHKLDEWHALRQWIECLPYAKELICLKGEPERASECLWQEKK